MKKPCRCNTNVSFRTENIPQQKPSHKAATVDTLEVVRDARLSFHVHGRKFFLAPPRRLGGPYYIRFEPPSTSGIRVDTVHRSLRTNVIGAAKARAKLIIEPILNGQWETAEKLLLATPHLIT